MREFSLSNHAHIYESLLEMHVSCHWIILVALRYLPKFSLEFVATTNVCLVLP